MPGEELTIESLERWESSGAQWRIVLLRDDLATIDFCTCTGEPVERQESGDPALIAFLREGAQAY